ncbi:hypothetical protein PIB30_029706 [Stylosanthes scabra]|uniref:Uncharacterized protein n=1 Tax=Stylosanthes scabra TaxID=79078 RepID=A0ABU6WED9_9FABA|nr:hypothetical protein [Stylosanthes scabra]
MVSGRVVDLFPSERDQRGLQGGHQGKRLSPARVGPHSGRQLFWCGSGKSLAVRGLVDELFKGQCARTMEEHFSFHKNLQCSSDLQGTAGGGPARPLRRSSQIRRTLMSLSEEMEKRTYLT